MRFTKMHGLGNDYVYVDTFSETVADPRALAIAMSRRHFGVGADGLVLIGPSVDADFTMRMFNADGSEAEMCGNAARCVGKYVHDRGLTRKTRLTLATASGVRLLELTIKGDCVDQVTVDMGEPVLQTSRIPAIHATDTVREHPLSILGREWRITCVNMGNPHAVVFVNDLATIDVQAVGTEIERHPMFPHRTNTEFVHVAARDALAMRVWERGSGETLACGTGAAASLVAAVLCGLADRSAQVRLTGGMLQLAWDADTGHVYQTGPATFVFDGVWPGS